LVSFQRKQLEARSQRKGKLPQPKKRVLYRVEGEKGHTSDDTTGKRKLKEGRSRFPASQEEPYDQNRTF